MALDETSAGYYLQFEFTPGMPIPFDRLERQSKGVEILSVNYDEDRTRVVVFVPTAAKALFAEKISEYLSDRRTTRTNKRLNRGLIEAIEEIELGGLKSIWKGHPEAFPAARAPNWWEVWIRADAKEHFNTAADKLHLTRYAGQLTFLDRVVVLVYSTAEQLETVRVATGALAELRAAEAAALFFIDRPPEEQAAIAAEVAARVVPPGAAAPAISILDNGVNHAHPLLAPALAEQDVHAVHPAWPRTDGRECHGSGMAGLALYGELAELLQRGEGIALTHRLESVRILPTTGAHDPALYGAVTAEAVGRVEVAAPQRRRAFCMAITAPKSTADGRPSSWSAELDRLSSPDAEEATARRLFLVAVGNIRDPSPIRNYLDKNVTSACESPSQSWNALSIGAFTEKVELHPAQFADWTVVAPSGELAPSSRTSSLWSHEWPIKPEILFEGGNWALDPKWTATDALEQLSMLTTSSRLPMRYFEAFGDTSGATALGARIAGRLLAEYSTYWPETIRALIVHGAQWTRPMQQKFDASPLAGRGGLLRLYGYGVPDLERTVHSARNELTLIEQSSISPFKEDEKGNVVLNEMKTFALPWPVDVLRDLGAARVEMRVTLSYFIEPNPAERGWRGRHRYRSHGLRFKVKRANESVRDFHRRINQAAREEDEGYEPSVIEEDAWFLGPRNRDVGSIHSDFLVDSAANIAARGVLAVHPVSGWWKERRALARFDSEARFSLVVSLRTEEVTADVYTPVAAQVAAPVLVEA